MAPVVRVLLSASTSVLEVALAASSLPSERAVTDDIVVTQVSADPAAVSGIVAFFVEISGTVGREQRSYLIPFMTVGQEKPQIGQTCSVIWTWSTTGGTTGYGQNVAGGRRVNKFHCQAAR
jgi:hypothetical protein